MEPGGDLQFDKIEPTAAAPAGPLACASCTQPIALAYWDIGGGRMLCDPCKGKVEAALTGGSGMRRAVGALAYGGLASLAGAILYFAVVKLTGYEIGLISILVGWLVGTAVRKGTGGRGGRWYQVMALVLTYCSVAASYAPMIYESFVKDGELTSSFERVFAVVFSYAVGFAAPVIILVSEPGSGILGVLIIGFGLHQAWRIPKAFEFQPQGPFTLAPKEPARAAVGEEPARDVVA